MCTLLTPLGRSIVGAGRRGLAAQSLLIVPGSGRLASEPRQTIRTWAASLPARPGSVYGDVTGNRSQLSQAVLAGHLKQLYPCGRHLFARTFHASAAFPAKSTLSKKTPKYKSRKPEDLYPDSFPRQGELVNPSGRIYSVLRDPNEEQLQGYARGGGNTNVRKPSILRAILVGGALSFLCYEFWAFSSASQTLKIAEQIESHGRSAFGNLCSSLGMTRNDKAKEYVPGHDGISQDQLQAFKILATAQLWSSRVAVIVDSCARLGIGSDTREWISKECTRVALGYCGLPDWQKAAVPIVVINTGVFLLWNMRHLMSLTRSIKWEDMMSRRFVHMPNTSRHYTLLTSTFSHQSLGHFIFNNYALWTCGAVAFSVPAFYEASLRQGTAKSNIVAEASIVQHFLAFFVVAGTFASLVSHLGTAIRWRVAAQWLKQKQATIATPGSLGASGAVYATFALTAMALPENRIGIIFLPSDFSVPIRQGMLAIVCLDIVGLVLRWRSFDHLAHLAGAAFGYFYFHYGAAIWKRIMGEDCVRMAKQKAKEKRKQGGAIENKS